jgi:hypothetical protein
MIANRLNMLAMAAVRPPATQVDTAPLAVAPGITPATDLRGLGSDEQHRVLKRLERISRLFDEAIGIPGTPFRLGWDAILGLIPVVGDGATTLVSAYYMWEAQRMGARKRTLGKMLVNVGIDFVVGTIPLVGDLADVAWRANRKNMQVLIRELQRQGKLPTEVSDERVAKLLASHAKVSAKATASGLSAGRPLMMP